MNKIGFFWLFFLPMTALAATEVWNPAAQQICAQLTQAIDDYKQGDVKKAHSQAIMAYFQGYDATLEPGVRMTLGAAHVFDVEHQFRDVASLFKKDSSADHIHAAISLVAKLCEAVKADAKALNEANIPLQVYKVQS